MLLTCFSHHFQLSRSPCFFLISDRTNPFLSLGVRCFWFRSRDGSPALRCQHTPPGEFGFRTLWVRRNAASPPKTNEGSEIPRRSALSERCSGGHQWLGPKFCTNHCFRVLHLHMFHCFCTLCKTC